MDAGEIKDISLRDNPHVASFSVLPPPTYNLYNDRFHYRTDKPPNWLPVLPCIFFISQAARVQYQSPFTIRIRHQQITVSSDPYLDGHLAIVSNRLPINDFWLFDDSISVGKNI
jgi:hypothetical protein